MIKFVLMVNKQGQTRLAQYYDFLSIQERVALEAEIIRKCLGRNENQASCIHLGFLMLHQLHCSNRKYCTCMSIFFLAVFVCGIPWLQGDLPTIRIALLHCRRERRR